MSISKRPEKHCALVTQWTTWQQTQQDIHTRNMDGPQKSADSKKM